ncbi:PLP-dependent aminotransferase family protein [Corynebacterium variabile]|uniref:MocR-like pyridoxine biosynthesis transcription factor PdxR n=1 Tax=Corynebacterium variabile TaxID=1727 RepID=UPI003A94F531
MISQSLPSATDDWSSLAGITPLHARVAEYLRRGLRRGEYPLNRPMPPSRVLAEQLGISRTTVQTALQTLLDEQVIVSRPRSGMYPVESAAVAESVASPVDWNQLFYKVAPPVPQIVEPDHSRYPFPFLSGQIEQAAFPTRSWLKAVNQAMSGKNLRVALGDPRDGDDQELVSALIEEVLALRGVHATPDEVMITVGTQQGLHLLTRALLGPGVQVAMENPGYVDAEHVFSSSGARMQYMAVDGAGASPDDAAGAHVIYLTPSSHHPTSVTLSPERRQRFLALAEAQDAILIEDDYDAEIRLQGPPLAPMKSLDQSGRVVYLGTFSKYLAPGLRMGYVVAVPELIAQLRSFRHYATKAPSPMLQRSLALFIRSGDYARQLRSYRVKSRAKFTRFAEAVGEYLPEFADQLTVPQMNMWLRMPERLDGGAAPEAVVGAEEWSQHARARGVLVTPGSMYYAPGTTVRDDELRVGLASIPEARIAAGVRALGCAGRHY